MASSSGEITMVNTPEDLPTFQGFNIYWQQNEWFLPGLRALWRVWCAKLIWFFVWLRRLFVHSVTARALPLVNPACSRRAGEPHSIKRILLKTNAIFSATRYGGSCKCNCLLECKCVGFFFVNTQEIFEFHFLLPYFFWLMQFCNLLHFIVSSLYDQWKSSSSPLQFHLEYLMITNDNNHNICKDKLPIRNKNIISPLPYSQAPNLGW